MKYMLIFGGYVDGLYGFLVFVVKKVGEGMKYGLIIV